MAEYTPKENYYKWNITDEMEETFQQFNATADKLDNDIYNLKTKPYADAHKIVAATIQPSTWTKIQSPASVNKGGGIWSSTGEFTVPSSGVYQCALVAYIDGLIDGNALATSVYINGVLGNQNRLEQRQCSGTADGIIVGSTVIDCTIGDVLSFWIFHGNSAAKDLIYAHMKITKI